MQRFAQPLNKAERDEARSATGYEVISGFFQRPGGFLQWADYHRTLAVRTQAGADYARRGQHCTSDDCPGEYYGHGARMRDGIWQWADGTR